MQRNPLANLIIRWFLIGLQSFMWACAILLAVLAIYILSPAGARDRANAEQRMLGEIADESLSFCEKFGMPVGTEPHQRCVIELQRIRENEDQRTGTSGADLL